MAVGARRGHAQIPYPGWRVQHVGPLSAFELGLVAMAYVGDRDPPGVLTGLVTLHLLRLPWLPQLTTAHVLVPEHVRRSSSGRVTVSRVTDPELR